MTTEKVLLTTMPIPTSGLAASAGWSVGSIYTPVVDTVITAIHTPILTPVNAVSLTPLIFNETTKALVATGPMLPAAYYYRENYVKMPLSAPIKLLKDQPYLMAVMGSGSQYASTNVVPEGTYLTEEGFGFKTPSPAQSLRYQSGNAYPANSSGFNQHLTLGFTVVVPETPAFSLTSGLVEQAKEPLNLLYSLTDSDKIIARFEISVGNVTVLNTTSPAAGAGKQLNLSSYWSQLDYGKNTMTVKITDTYGRVQTQTYTFHKLVNDSADLIASIQALQKSAAQVTSKRDAISLLLGLAQGASFEVITEELRGNLVKIALGSMYVGGLSMPDGLMNVRGLDFSPTIILIKETKTSGFGRSYVYAKQYANTYTMSNYFFGGATSQFGYATPIIYEDGFYIGPDGGQTHNDWINRMGTRTLEYIAIG